MRLRHTVTVYPLIFLILLVLAFVNPLGAADEEEYAIEPLIDGVVYFGQTTKEFGVIYFRGRAYGYDYVTDLLWGKLVKVEGVDYVSYSPYEISIGRCGVYTWDEIKENLKPVLESYIEAVDKAEMKKTKAAKKDVLK